MPNVSIPKADLTGQSAYIASALADLQSAVASPPATQAVIQSKVNELGARLNGAAYLISNADAGSSPSTYSGGTGCTPHYYNS